MADIDKTARNARPKLDKDLERLTFVERANLHVARGLAPYGMALIFLIFASVFALGFAGGHPGSAVLIAAAALAGYMAINIGANDVTNNVGAAVGARAMTMTGALIMAAFFEIAGAMIAGGEVTDTIASGILTPSLVGNAQTFIWIMMAALLAAAFWINLATWANAPVSTTHSIVGSVMGAAAAAMGTSAVNWQTVLSITVGWLISPLLGGLIASAMLYLIYDLIVYRADKIAQARRWLPVLIGLMAGCFSCYLSLKTTGMGFTILSDRAVLFGTIIGILAWLLAIPVIRRQAVGLENRNQSLRQLFRMPLIGAAALLSFAHGANDVSNAIGPLAAIVHALFANDLHTRMTAPFWVVTIGALGISVGLLLFGPRLIRLVGSKITKLNPMRAYCISLSSGITVITASKLGLPVSSTHIAIGAVFGLGFFREWYNRHSPRRLAYMQMKSAEWQSKPPKRVNPDELKRRQLVRRSHILTIMGAWLVTLPISAGLAALIYSVMFALFR
ncbi:inorganic phosphate transporter [Allorhizobium taibaishanense]|uniref:Phosphate transporter n=1 Tax=Allorhizobium taibaishanense TaxID=887144 RepID=A0A1Q9A655_9HYPH|nr:inorganic phosphate transporter [Allorhizobium taibaishanense]MBB4008820.1 PiT family inorganic phosphate transporter [Allorhizobium taibaishanense]OLP50064.1 inorganic phosphate transporter [Allorhizobium taibaishanense]